MRKIIACLCAAACLSVATAALPAHAQDPSPHSFMQDVEPPNTPPIDGASVLVVEGTGAGVTGCVHNITSIVNMTVANINQHKPTVTEISPQSQSANPAGCFYNATVQDWQNAILQIVTGVENGAPDAPTWWGGVMLDEEDGFWTSSDSFEAYSDLNGAVETLMAPQLGISWYYTETFSSLNAWSQEAFSVITGDSHAAPAIATDYMVQLANQWQLLNNQSLLVTWSLNVDYRDIEPHGFYGSEFRINGAPLNQWGMNLSNCFTTGNELCDDWDGDGTDNASDPDNDNDHCPDVDEPARGLDPLDPWDFYSVPSPPLFLDPSAVADNGIGLASDVLTLLYYDGISSDAPHYTADYDSNDVEDGLQYDRSYSGGNPGPPDGGIGQGTDVLAMLRETGWTCD